MAKVRPPWSKRITSSSSMSSAAQASTHSGIVAPSCACLDSFGSDDARAVIVGDGLGTRRQGADHVVGRLPELPDDRRDDLPIGGPAAWIGSGAIALDLLVQCRERVV